MPWLAAPTGAGLTAASSWHLLGGQQLVVVSLYRPPRGGEQAMRQFRFLSLLMEQLRKGFPRAHFLIGGSFNIEPQKTTADAQLLQDFAISWGLQVIDSDEPTTSARHLDYFLASKELTQPGSMCSVVRAGSGGKISDSFPVQVTAHIR